MKRSVLRAHIATLAHREQEMLIADVNTLTTWAIKRAMGTPNITPYGFCYAPQREHESFTERLGIDTEQAVHSAYPILVYRQVLRNLRLINDTDIQASARAEAVAMLKIFAPAYAKARAALRVENDVLTAPTPRRAVWPASGSFGDTIPTAA